MHLTKKGSSAHGHVVLNILKERFIPRKEDVKILAFKFSVGSRTTTTLQLQKLGTSFLLVNDKNNKREALLPFRSGNYTIASYLQVQRGKRENMNDSSDSLFQK